MPPVPLPPGSYVYAYFDKGILDILYFISPCFLYNITLKVLEYSLQIGKDSKNLDLKSS